MSLILDKQLASKTKTILRIRSIFATFEKARLATIKPIASGVIVLLPDVTEMVVLFRLLEPPCMPEECFSDSCCRSQHACTSCLFMGLSPM